MFEEDAVGEEDLDDSIDTEAGPSIPLLSREGNEDIKN
jgi:hypothetical protein